MVHEKNQHKFVSLMLIENQTKCCDTYRTENHKRYESLLIIILGSSKQTGDTSQPTVENMYWTSEISLDPLASLYSQVKTRKRVKLRTLHSLHAYL